MFTQHIIKQIYQITSLQEKLKLKTTFSLHSNILEYGTIES